MTQFIQLIQSPKLGEEVQNLIDTLSTDIVDKIGIPKDTDIDILQPKEKAGSQDLFKDYGNKATRSQSYPKYLDI